MDPCDSCYAKEKKQTCIILLGKNILVLICLFFYFFAGMHPLCSAYKKNSIFKRFCLCDNTSAQDMQMALIS